MEFRGSGLPRLVTDPSEPSFCFQQSPPGQPQSQQYQDLDTEKKSWLQKAVSAKDKYSARLVKDRFRGPDTSSLTAFLFSLLSCSESDGRHTDDLSSEDVDDTETEPPVLLRSKGCNNHRFISSSTHNNFLEGGLQQESRTSKQDVSNEDMAVVGNDNESEWQLITEHDLGGFGNDGTFASDKQQISLPKMSDTSLILSESIRSFLHSALPTLVRGRKWMLLYSTWRHGISLLTLYRCSALVSGPLLLVATDYKGAVFGGLLSSPLKPSSKKKYQGTNETFVFTNITGKLSVFHPTGLNRYFVLCMNDALAFGGGGHFALYLDGELLHGSSGPCETFGNCCLAQTEDFVLKHVELWGFVHTSRYTPYMPRHTSFKELIEASGVYGSPGVYESQ